MLLAEFFFRRLLLECKHVPVCDSCMLAIAIEAVRRYQTVRLNRHILPPIVRFLQLAVSPFRRPGTRELGMSAGSVIPAHSSPEIPPESDGEFDCSSQFERQCRRIAR